MADIFVSYKKEDRAIADRFVAALKAAGKSVWWDDALNPSQAWDSIIEREIAACSHVIVLWTPRSVQSDWVRSEAHYAQDHGKLVPVMVERCTLPIAFMLRQSVDLASGVFDDSNPQWVRLIGWLAGAVPEPGGPGSAEAIASAQAAVPIKAMEGARWLGPARRPSLAIAGVVAALALAVCAFLFRVELGIVAPPQPDVVVDAFTTGKGVPDGLAKGVVDEMFTGFSSSSRITPVPGDGKRRPGAYQMTGDIVAAGDQIQVFAKLFAPNVAAPVLTIKLDNPATDKALPVEFGLPLAQLMRCVATASDSIGSKLTTLPSTVLGQWAKFCQQTIIDDASTPESIAANLRGVVAAAPNFANAWANLAEALQYAATNPGADKAGLLAESEKAADRALALDPKTAKALVVKAWNVLGIAGPIDGSGGIGKLHNFKEWEALARKSISVRPSDCGCEVPQYAEMLMLFGRPSAALPLMQQAVSTDPNATGHAAFLADITALTGNPGAADKQLADLAEKRPDVKWVNRRRFLHALWRRDWGSATLLLDARPSGPDRDALPALLTALSRGDAAAARTAGLTFIAIGTNRQTMSQRNLTAIAIAGYPDEAAAALEQAAAQNDMSVLAAAYSPSLAAMRKTKGFAALAEKTGLIDYWKMPGHRPDFCNEPDPAALCATVSKS